jgi:hypothetical protein
LPSPRQNRPLIGPKSPHLSAFERILGKLHQRSYFLPSTVVRSFLGVMAFGLAGTFGFVPVRRA